MENKVMLMMAVVFNLSGHEIDWPVLEMNENIVASFDVEQEEAKLQQIVEELGALQDSSLKRKRSEDPTSDSEEGRYEVTNITHNKKSPLVRDAQGRYLCQWPGCGKRLTQSSHLKTHMLIHTGKKQYACPERGCGKSFAQNGNLKYHTDNKVCQKNGKIKQVNSSGDLAGERPHKCPDPACGKAFARKGDLKYHTDNKVCQKNKIGGINGK